MRKRLSSFVTTRAFEPWRCSGILRTRVRGLPAGLQPTSEPPQDSETRPSVEAVVEVAIVALAPSLQERSPHESVCGPPTCGS